MSPQSEETGGTVLRRRSTRTGASSWAAGSPELADALRAEERLVSARNGGFRALTVSVALLPIALNELTVRFEAWPVNVSALFLGALRGLVDAKPKPTWETVLAADSAEPGSRAALKLAEYTSQAWRLVAPQLVEARAIAAPLLPHDVGVLARYDGMSLLQGLVESARCGGSPLWVLCPVDHPSRKPRIDGVTVQADLPHEQIALPDSWVGNEHRGGTQAG